MYKVFIMIFFSFVSNVVLAQDYIVCKGSFFGHKTPQIIFPEIIKFKKPIACTQTFNLECVGTRILKDKNGKEIFNMYEYFKKNKKLIVKSWSKKRHYSCK